MEASTDDKTRLNRGRRDEWTGHLDGRTGRENDDGRIRKGHKDVRTGPDTWIAGTEQRTSMDMTRGRRTPGKDARMNAV